MIYYISTMSNVQGFQRLIIPYPINVASLPTFDIPNFEEADTME